MEGTSGDWSRAKQISCSGTHPVGLLISPRMVMQGWGQVAGRGRTRTVDRNWLNEYSILYDVILNNETSCWLWCCLGTGWALAGDKQLCTTLVFVFYFLLDYPYLYPWVLSLLTLLILSLTPMVNGCVTFRHLLG